MAPTLPEIPGIPKLTWQYKDGVYYVSEEDCDKLLDYGENILPTYKWEMGVYKKQLDLVMKYL